MAKINVKDTEITIISVEEKDYISLTIWQTLRKAKAVLPTSSKIGLEPVTHLNF